MPNSNSSSPHIENPLRILDCTVLTGYVAAALVGVAHHEPWADEAEAWLIARDVPFWKMILHEMHYEGSPGLWHFILWIAQHLFHLPYAAIGYIGAVFAICGAAVLIFLAPFPRIVRYLIASSYYVVYQYAVLARPYVLLLLFAALAAHFYRKRNYVAMAVALAFLSGSSIHGAIIAGAIAVAAGWRALSEWSTIAQRSRNNCIAAGAIVATAFAMVVVIAYPASDVTAWVDFGHRSGIGKLINTVNNVLLEPWIFGLMVFVAIFAFTLWRKQATPLVLSMGMLGLLQVRIYGNEHHSGAMVIAIIISLWIAWPEPSEQLPVWVRPAATIVLSGLFAAQTIWAIGAWKEDYRLPYSGAVDAAKFLKESGASQSPSLYGVGYSIVGVQAYFDRNIFANWKSAYVHHSKTGEDEAEVMHLADKPEYAVFAEWNLGPDNDPSAMMAQNGYVLVHLSPGVMFFKQTATYEQTYLIYHRLN